VVLQCLLDLAKLPYAKLHPYKALVRRGSRSGEEGGMT
jgi:hypothetical protein